MKSIFVSSTFKDMQAERDMLHMEVMPRLQEKARNYGERISFIDLRWGVDTGDMDSEEGAKKVLSVCLDEIDRCRPYMLIFLGERYGWIPESRLIENAIAEKGFSVEDIEESVTALEIEYGVFSSKEAVERCIFCIREPLPFNEMPHEIQKDYIAESSIHKSKLEALKKRIKQLHGAEIITYRAEWHKNKVCGLEVLSEQLYALFIKMFEKEWLKKSDLSWQDRELMEFQLFMEEKRSCFVGRQSLIDHYYNLINDTQYKAFILQGEEGSGKSSMLSMLTERLIQKNYIVFPFICGNSGKSDDLDDMIKQMVYFLETHLELSHLGEENQGKSNKTITREKWRERFFELCESYGKTKKRPFAFVIDALEQLKEQDEAGSFSWIPPFFSQNIIFIVSFKNDFKANLFHEDVLIQEDFCVQELELLQDSNKKELIKGILAANHKGLDEIVVDALVNKKSSDNPMYLSMLLTRLMMMDREDFLEADRMGGGGEGLDALMISIIEQAPEELQEMSAALIQEAARRCSPKQAQETLYLLAASRRGLREEDLEAIILSSNKVWNTVDFSRLLRYMQSYFVIREDGCVDFTYPMTRKGLLKDDTMKIDEYQNRIFNYIKTLPEGDTLRTSEALYYARLADDKTFALSFLDTLVYANPEIKEIGKSAIIELIKDEGSSWFTEVCLLSHTLNRYCEQFLYDYLVHDVLAQPVWGINEGNRLIVSCSVLEGILENVFSLIDNFDDPCFYFKEEDIYLATRDVDAYMNVVQLIIHSIWHIVENYIEFLQHKRAMTLLNTLVNFIEEVKEKVYSFYEEAISDIHRWIDEWNVTEDSEPYKSANCYLNDIKEQWDKFLFDIVKTNLCYAQLLINNGDYIDAMNYLKKAEMENDDIEWFESNIYRIAIIEAYHEIFIAKEGVEESLGDEAKKRCGILNKGYHSTYKRSLELYGALNNEYAFLLRDGALKQAYYQLRINMDEAFDYCEEAVKYAEDALKLVNTPKNQLAYSDTLLLRAMYWYSQGELEKANKDMDQVYWLKTKKDLDQTFFLYGVLEEGDILSNFFYDVCKLDLADHQDEKEMKFILEIISGNWKLVKVYMETALNNPNNMIVHRKKLHAILESINLVTKALANKKCFDEALYYCNEALSYWEKCGCPIYPVQMFVNDVYDLVTRKGKLLEKLGKAEESIQVFKGILSFNKVADITNYKTLSWVLQKREEVEWEFTLLFIEDFVVNEINFTFDESEYNFEEIVEKFNRIAMAYDYANDSHAEYYYACKVKWSESCNEKEDSCESLSAVAYSNSAMAYWYERNNELEKAITYYEKAMNCCERLYQITQDLEQMEGYKRISERIQKLSNDLKQVEVEQ